MRVDRRALLAVLIVLAGAAVTAWRLWGPSEARAIRNRLVAFSEEVNAGTTDGLGTMARAAAIGSFLTEDVVVDLGQGTALITGRDTVMGMAARLQPRTAAFQLKLDDIDVHVHPGNTVADVDLTGSFIRRSVTTGEESMDAREFDLVMSKSGGVWRIAHLTAVETLK